MFSFPPLLNSSITIGLRFLFKTYQKKYQIESLFYISYLGCAHQRFYQYYP